MIAHLVADQLWINWAVQVAQRMHQRPADLLWIFIQLSITSQKLKHFAVKALNVTIFLPRWSCLPSCQKTLVQHGPHDLSHKQLLNTHAALE